MRNLFVLALSAALIAGSVGCATHGNSAERQPSSKDSEETDVRHKSNQPGRGGVTRQLTIDGFYYSWRSHPMSVEARAELHRQGVSAAQLEAQCRRLSRTNGAYTWKDGQCHFAREDFAVIRTTGRGAELVVDNWSDCRLEFLLKKAGKRDLFEGFQERGGRCRVAVHASPGKLTVQPLTDMKSCACANPQGVFPILINAARADLDKVFHGRIGAR